MRTCGKFVIVDEDDADFDPRQVPHTDWAAAVVATLVFAVIIAVLIAI